MSDRYPGGIITKTPVVPSGPYEDSTAPGIWTLEQQAYYEAQGLWPTAGNTNPSAFIENLFSTYLYTGNGSTQTITNGIDITGEGALVWIKQRSSTGYHILTDTTRGAGLNLSSNVDIAQYNDGQPTFNNNGFNLINSNPDYNGNGSTYASWTFRKQAKFFDIVTYTGTGTNRTVSHNLSSTPGCIITKKISSTGEWFVYHRSQDNYAYTTRLNSTAGQGTLYTAYSATPTSTQFSVDGDLNTNGATYVAYLFAHDAGGFGTTGTDNVISCGSFTTDGSGNATVNLGYEPQWVLYKAVSTTGNWFITDNMRGFYASTTANILRPNTDGIEQAAVDAFPNATGFSVAPFVANATYIYIAIRRGPMATPTTGTSVFSPIYIDSGQGTTGFPIDLQLSNYTSGSSYNTVCVDRLRGVSSNSTDSGYALVTSQTSAEASGVFSKSFNNTGFSVPLLWDGVTTIYYNFRRAPGFFDVVCWAGNGTARTINHNLGVAPEFLIVKARGGAADWYCYHKDLGNNQDIRLDLDNASQSSTRWSNTSPTSSVFSIAANQDVNWSGINYVAYLFATVAGVSKVGSYTGTGTTKQINCEFTGGARFVLIKRTDSTGDWYVWDTARGIVSGNDPYLLLNSTAAQVTNTDYVDTYSAGFEISSTAPAAINANGGSYIYLAIA